jgi:hypothetical protein
MKQDLNYNQIIPFVVNEKFDEGEIFRPLVLLTHPHTS